MLAYVASVFLMILMFGMGLDLRVEDFRRIVVFPKAATLGLVGQLVMLPLLGFALATVLDASPEFAVGIVLLTMCPGGALSNLFSHLAGADVALSVTMTSISSLVTVFTIPVVLSFALLHFMDESAAIALPIGPAMLQIMMITVIPVSVGMFVLNRWPRFAARGAPAVRAGSMLFLPMMLVGMAMSDVDRWLENLTRAGLVTTGLTLLTIFLGYLIGRLFGLDRRQVVTLAIEIGAQNAMLGVAIAVSPFMLNSLTIAIVPTVYGLTMVVVLALYVAVLNWVAPLNEVRLPAERAVAVAD